MKKIFVLFLLFITHCSLFISYGQPTQEWVRRYTGPSNDNRGPFLAVDSSGNSYIAGTHVVGSPPINILIVKYSPSGIQQWATLYNPEGCQHTYGIALDALGNAYVIAEYATDCLSNPNIMTIKYNALNGQIQWDKRYVGLYGLSEPSDIKIDRLDNIFVVGGSSDSSLLCIKYNQNGDSLWVRRWHPPGDFAGAWACAIDDSLNIIMTGKKLHCPFSSCYDSVLTIKYSTDGIFRWARTYGNDALTDVGIKIVTDQFGNSYIGGETRISSYGAYLTLKYDRNGNQQWAALYNAIAPANSGLYSIAVDKQHNSVFVTGDMVANNKGFATTIRYNSLTGDSIWVRRDTGTYGIGGSRDIKVDSVGNIYIAGATSNTGSNAPVDILSIKYSLQGNLIWQTTYNGPYNGLDVGRYIGLDYHNNVYVLGASQSAFQVSDYVLIKYAQTVGIKQLSNEIIEEYRLYQNYPNPFNPKTKIKFDIPKAEVVQIKIYDVLGKLVATLVNENLSPGKYETEWNASDFASGVYYYQLVVNSEQLTVYSETKKLVLIK